MAEKAICTLNVREWVLDTLVREKRSLQLKISESCKLLCQKALDSLHFFMKILLENLSKKRKKLSKKSLDS